MNFLEPSASTVALSSQLLEKRLDQTQANSSHAHGYTMREEDYLTHPNLVQPQRILLVKWVLTNLGGLLVCTKDTW